MKRKERNERSEGILTLQYNFLHFSSHRSLPEILSSSPNLLREDVKRLKLIELQLQDEIKSLTIQRDGLVMELQQLQEAKPMLMQAYTVTICEIKY